MVPVHIANISLSHLGFVVLLRAIDDGKQLPIFIGAPEAQAIAVIINEIETPRPMTHDLMANMLRTRGCRVGKIAITDLKENTFFARIFVEFIETPSQNFDIDSRPSDAIAMALRFEAPIFVAEHVLADAGIAPTSQTGNTTTEPAKEPSRMEILQGELVKAIQEERYEEAARIRDALTELKKKIEPN